MLAWSIKGTDGLGRVMARRAGEATHIVQLADLPPRPGVERRRGGVDECVEPGEQPSEVDLVVRGRALHGEKGTRRG